MGVGVLTWRENVEVNLANDEWLAWIGGGALVGLVADAHTAATQYAVTDEIWAPGGLTRLKNLRDIANHRVRFW